VVNARKFTANGFVLKFEDAGRKFDVRAIDFLNWERNDHGAGFIITLFFFFSRYTNKTQFKHLPIFLNLTGAVISSAENFPQEKHQKCNKIKTQ